MKKKILIFGSNGLLTTNLSKRFTSKYDYILIGSKNYDIKFNVIDDSVDKYIKNIDFDIILNCVGLADINLCEKNKKLAKMLNIIFVENLVNSLIKYNIKSRIIHISTDQMYDGKGLKNEKSVSQINNYYTKTKLISENILSNYNTTILRTNFIGKSIHIYKKSLTDWIVFSLINNKKINVFKDIFFSPLTFDTLSKIIEEIFNIDKVGIFNLGSKIGISKAELGFFIAKKIKKDHLLNITSSDNYLEVKRSKDMRMDTSLFEKEFNIKLPRTNEELEKMVYFT